MKCRECNDYAKCVKESNLSIKRKNCKKAKTKYVMTNADRIRSMSDFELAKEIENAQSGIEIKNPKNIDYFDCILEWLRQPEEDET